MSNKIILQYTESQVRELLDRLVDLISVKKNYEQVILDCWELLQVKPRQKSQWLSTRLRNEELIENQEELINQLKETLEPVIDKIRCDGDNGHTDNPGDVADTPSEVEIETPQEEEPSNGGTKDDQPA